LASSPALELLFDTGRLRYDARELLLAALDDFGLLAIHEDGGEASWIVHFAEAAERDLCAAALRDRASAFGLDRVVPIDVPDEDWARRSQAHLSAVTIGAFVVAPPWDVPAGVDPDHVIVIDPSTGFGTGHHQTTRLCLRHLQALPVRGARVIDVGTGSGVLAIAAARLGAHAVVAVDHDADALTNARANVDRNAVAGRVDLVAGDLSFLAADPAAIVVANLTAAVIERHAPALRALVAPGGVLVVSGFGPPELPAVLEHLGLSSPIVATEDDWVAAACVVPLA
jgi:ribosomal protein L11 methyltransferase